MPITVALLVEKMAMHKEKADVTLLHHANVVILNRQYGTEGQLHNLECSHVNKLTQQVDTTGTTG